MVAYPASKSEALGIQVHLVRIASLIGDLELKNGINGEEEVFLIYLEKIRLCFINGIPDWMLALKRFLTAAHPFAVIHQKAVQSGLIRFSQMIRFPIRINIAQRIG